MSGKQYPETELVRQAQRTLADPNLGARAQIQAMMDRLPDSDAVTVSKDLLRAILAEGAPGPTSGDYPEIPRPATRPVVHGASRELLAIEINDVVVLYSSENFNVMFATMPSASFDPASLDRALKSNRHVGSIALVLELECGEKPDPTSMRISRHADTLNALAEAIPHLYPLIHAHSTREALRMIYAQLP